MWELCKAVDSQYMEPPPSDMEKLCDNEKDETQFKVSIKDISDNSIEQSSEDVLVCKE